MPRLESIFTVILDLRGFCCGNVCLTKNSKLSLHFQHLRAPSELKEAALIDNIKQADNMLSNPSDGC